MKDSDQDQKKWLLRSKLQANAQRNARTEYIAALPPALGDYLQACQFILSPELDSLLSYFGLISKDAHQSLLDVEGYEYHQFSWVSQVFDLVLRFGSDYDVAPAHFCIGSEGPLFCTPFGWVRQNIEALFSVRYARSFGKPVYSPQGLGIITTDLAAGIVIDSYCGYLPSDPNPEEIVYELATWQALR